LALAPFHDRGTDLECLCSFHYEATVLNDNTVRLGGMVIDVPPGRRKRSYAGVRSAVSLFGSEPVRQ